MAEMEETGHATASVGTHRSLVRRAGGGLSPSPPSLPLFPSVSLSPLPLRLSLHGVPSPARPSLLRSCIACMADLFRHNTETIICVGT